LRSFIYHRLQLRHNNLNTYRTMARILITGSSDGLGSLVAQKLISRGHSVVLHARNDKRAQDATAAAPGAEAVVTGDLSDVASTKSMAKQINDLGSFDCIIHNAGLYQGGFRKTSDGLPALAAVNTLAPFILTALVSKPKRLVFLSSEMHQSGLQTCLIPYTSRRAKTASATPRRIAPASCTTFCLPRRSPEDGLR
jgi:NAD(P)-dependent dehydrogenase (short-subunit alcohol dehydrogenase family)